MQFVFWIIIFIFGAALGSFVNVVADRYNTGLAWWQGKSFCFACSQKLGTKDLFPVFSFLFLKGRCRYCRSKIPSSAFWVELLMGATSILIAHQVGFLNNLTDGEAGFQFLIFNSIFAVLLLIAVYDLRHFIIPDSFLVTFFFFSLFSLSVIHNSLFIILNILSGVALALPFLILFFFSKGRWLGLGDVKYIAVIGFGLGLVKGISAVLLAFWVAAGFALILLFVSKKNLTMKSEVPFGPFLSLGFGLAWFLDFDPLHLNDFWLNL